ncbi:hypothetical protein HDU96_007587 [Phlyctochytrium bullatum]|nr:hypothetical protein HDU96_007587 [Phlyctochytrium bullatum]
MAALLAPVAIMSSFPSSVYAGGNPPQQPSSAPPTSPTTTSAVSQGSNLPTVDGFIDPALPTTNRPTVTLPVAGFTDPFPIPASPTTVSREEPSNFINRMRISATVFYAIVGCTAAVLLTAVVVLAVVLSKRRRKSGNHANRTAKGVEGGVANDGPHSGPAGDPAFVATLAGTGGADGRILAPAADEPPSASSSKADTNSGDSIPVSAISATSPSTDPHAHLAFDVGSAKKKSWLWGLGAGRSKRWKRHRDTLRTSTSSSALVEEAAVVSVDGNLHAGMAENVEFAVSAGSVESERIEALDSRSPMGGVMASTPAENGTGQTPLLRTAISPVYLPAASVGGPAVVAGTNDVANMHPFFVGNRNTTDGMKEGASTFAGAASEPAEPVLPGSKLLKRRQMVPKYGGSGAKSVFALFGVGGSPGRPPSDTVVPPGKDVGPWQPEHLSTPSQAAEHRNGSAMEGQQWESPVSEIGTIDSTGPFGYSYTCGLGNERRMSAGSARQVMGVKQVGGRGGFLGGGGGGAPSVSTTPSRSSFGTRDSQGGYVYRVLSTFLGKNAPGAVGDEVELATGDLVAVYTIFEDSWAHGLNVTTGQHGMFPLNAIRRQPGGLNHRGKNRGNSTVLPSSASAHSGGNFSFAYPPSRRGSITSSIGTTPSVAAKLGTILRTQPRSVSLGYVPPGGYANGGGMLGASGGSTGGRRDSFINHDDSVDSWAHRSRKSMILRSDGGGWSGTAGPRSSLALSALSAPSSDDDADAARSVISAGDGDDKCPSPVLEASSVISAGGKSFQGSQHTVLGPEGLRVPGAVPAGMLERYVVPGTNQIATEIILPPTHRTSSVHFDRASGMTSASYGEWEGFVDDDDEEDDDSDDDDEEEEEVLAEYEGGNEGRVVEASEVGGDSMDGSAGADWVLPTGLAARKSRVFGDAADIHDGVDSWTAAGSVYPVFHRDKEADAEPAIGHGSLAWSTASVPLRHSTKNHRRSTIMDNRLLAMTTRPMGPPIDEACLSRRSHEEAVRVVSTDDASGAAPIATGFSTFPRSLGRTRPPPPPMVDVERGRGGGPTAPGLGFAVGAVSPLLSSSVSLELKVEDETRSQEGEVVV